VSESSRCVWVIFLRAGAVLPFIAILGESGPLFEVRWDVKRFEGLFKRVTPCHVGAAQRPGVRHPSGQEFARYASHGHARNVAGPSKDAVAVVVGEGFDPDAVEEGGGADAVAVGVGEGDAAHGTDACVVEGLESAQEVFAQAPDLAVVQQDGEYQGYVDPALDLEAEVPVGEDAVPERSKGCRCRLNAFVDVGVRGEAGGDYGAQVLELGAEVDEAAVSCELGLKETNPPTGSTQNRESIGWPH